MCEWYEFEGLDRIKNVYKKHSLQDFFNWWNDEKNQVMEIRFQEWKYADECSKLFFVQKHKQSVFIDNHEKLIKIVKYFSKHTTMWFGVNPKKKTLNKYGKNKYNDLDIGISKIKHIFIDIDRKQKNGPATKQDLMQADFLANKILEQLSLQNFDKNYMKICSGNGLQLIIKLDIPILLPNAEFDEIIEKYIETLLFKEIKKTIKEGIGKVLINYSAKIGKQYLEDCGEEFNAEVDTTCFNIGRVGALPYSFNFKHNTMIPRGIVEIKNTGNNEGLTDYLKQLFEEKKQRTKTIKHNNESLICLSEEYRLKENQLKKNTLIQLMLEHEFPNGGINNTLWYSLKILLHQSGITHNNHEYIKLHERLKKIHNRTFTDNGLEEEYKNNYNGSIKIDDINFVPTTVNKYLRLNKIKKLSSDELFYHKPIFPVSIKGKTKLQHIIDITKFSSQKQTTQKYDLCASDPLDDLKQLSTLLFNIRKGSKISENLIGTSSGNILINMQLQEIFSDFMQSFLEKWKREVFEYMLKYYMEDYLNYQKW